MNYAKPIDIAMRLHRHKRHWFHGNPKISLEGQPNSFGVLIFDFGDEVVKQRIYIRDREAILDSASLAVLDFIKLCKEGLESMY